MIILLVYVEQPKISLEFRAALQTRPTTNGISVLQGTDRNLYISRKFVLACLERS